MILTQQLAQPQKRISRGEGNLIVIIVSSYVTRNNFLLKIGEILKKERKLGRKTGL